MPAPKMAEPRREKPPPARRLTRVAPREREAIRMLRIARMSAAMPAGMRHANLDAVDEGRSRQEGQGDSQHPL